MQNPSAELSRFAAELSFEDIPQPVLRRTKRQQALASILAGSSDRPVRCIADVARSMGPLDGGVEKMVRRD